MVSISKVRAVLFGTLYHWFVASERQLTRPYPSFGQSPAAPHTNPPPPATHLSYYPNQTERVT